MRVEAGGFTLLELMLVIAIVVLLGGVGGGMYLGTHKKLLVEKAARQFLLMARYARIAAVEEQQPFDLEFDKDEGFGLTTTRQNEVSGQTEKISIRNYYCRPVQFEGDVKFEDARIVAMMDEPLADTQQEQKITFWPNGTAQSAVVQIGDGQTHYTISIVASTGRATLYFGPADAIKTGKNVTIDLDAQ
ncbi:MAG: prepilin-type N-terminal cleavage/methylation domain-containing protein [Sedimentisphaerales bacterium]|nr:prepilin-type N-terminal cleavage/methylation domain-containing protein [Sedimentisphaerales bacterium]